MSSTFWAAAKPSCALLIIAVLCICLKASHAADRPFRVSKVSLDKKTFDPCRKETVHISFSLSHAAHGSISLYDREDNLVRVLKEELLGPGAHSTLWNGRDASGSLLPDGYYIYSIEGKDAQGRTAVYDPADETGGRVVEVRKPDISSSGEISYIMPKAGMVRIRLGLHEGVLLRTLVDWEPREAGKVIEHWDGRDKSGLFNLLGHDRLQATLFAYSLPDNSIIVRSPGRDLTRTPPFEQKTAEAGIGGVAEGRSRRGHSEEEKVRINARFYREPALDLSFPKTLGTTEEGLPIVCGAVPVRIAVSSADFKHLQNTRFEVMVFVDTQFLFEEEEGISPVTYVWDTRGLPQGKHFLTVNVLSYDNHCGVESRQVWVQNE